LFASSLFAPHGCFSLAWFGVLGLITAGTVVINSWVQLNTSVPAVLADIQVLASLLSSFAASQDQDNHKSTNIL
jgi:membrane protein implicated in regulation of membrane protease activity